MGRALLILGLMTLPFSAWAENSPETAPDEGEAADAPEAESSDEPDDTSAPIEGEATPEAAEPPPPPIPSGLPGPALSVAHVQGIPDLSTGDQLEPGRSIEVPQGGCLRLLAGDAAAITLCGPARAELRPTEESRILLVLEQGRGTTSVNETGGSLVVDGHQIQLRGASAIIDAQSSQPARQLGEGEIMVDGAALESAGDQNASDELLSPWWCAPPRPTISVALGDPNELVVSAEQARRSREGEGGEEATAETGATCVDSQDASSASDPNSTDGGQIDPDVRRDEAGRLRVTITLPRRP